MPDFFQTNSAPLVIADFDYFRIPRERWELMLTRLKQMGANGVMVTLLWGFHEIESGVVDLHGVSNGRRDVVGLLHLLSGFDLPCFLNLGPYAERGVLAQGAPFWLLKEPEEQEAVRFSAVQRWYKTVSNTFVGEQWPNGPLIALLVDNDVAAGQSPALSRQLTEVKWPIWLRKRYGSIEALNEAYGATYRTVSRVKFPQTWADASSPLERDGQTFLTEMEVEVQSDFMQLLAKAGWDIPIYPSLTKTPEGLPALQRYPPTGQIEKSEAPLANVIQHIPDPIQVDPDPTNVGAAPAWAQPAPIRADGSLSPKFWQMRCALWPILFADAVCDEDKVIVAGEKGLLVSTGRDTTLKLETVAPLKTPVYRLEMTGELVTDEALRVTRKKLSGPYRVANEVSQTDLVLLLEDQTKPLDDFGLTYFKSLLLAQAYTLEHWAAAADALGEMLSEPDEDDDAGEAARPAKTSFILDEARRGLSEADAALRKAMASIGGLERGFATILDKDKQEVARSVPEPVTINPAAFSGAARKVLVEVGLSCADIAVQLETAAATLQKTVRDSESLTLEQYQQGFQTAVIAAQTARQPLLSLIGTLRLEIATERLPLVVWRVHDQVQAVAEGLRWGILRGIL